jgi:hypothetical protein
MEKELDSMSLLHEKFFYQGKAKIVDKAEFACVNEHFETIFNAAMMKKTNRGKISGSVS